MARVKLADVADAPAVDESPVEVQKLGVTAGTHTVAFPEMNVTFTDGKAVVTPEVAVALRELGVVE